MSEEASKVVKLEPRGKRKPSHESIWGKDVIGHGYTAVPSILLQAQARLGVSPLQMNIIIQLLDYWRAPDRHPFPSKKELAERLQVTQKTIQNNMRILEAAGLVKREGRRSSSGDWSSNTYRLDGLVERIQKFEPEFRDAREKSKEMKRLAGTPIGRRS